MPESALRQSITPTYDRQKTGDRFTVDTWVGDRRVSSGRVSDPFIHTKVTVGWRDLLRGLLRRTLVVTVVVGGDREIVEDVIELDSDYLGCTYSTRRKEWDAHMDQRLGDFAAQLGEHAEEDNDHV